MPWCRRRTNRPFPSGDGSHQSDRRYSSCGRRHQSDVRRSYGGRGLRHLNEGYKGIAVKRRPLLLMSVHRATNNNFEFLVRHDQILLWRNLFDLHYIRLNSPESTGWRREKPLFRTFFRFVSDVQVKKTHLNKLRIWKWSQIYILQKLYPSSYNMLFQ